MVGRVFSLSRGSCKGRSVGKVRAKCRQGEGKVRGYALCMSLIIKVFIVKSDG